MNFAVGVLNRVELLTHTGYADNIQRGSAHPLTYIDGFLRLVRSMTAVRNQGINQILRFRPEEWIKVLYPLARKGWTELSSLDLTNCTWWSMKSETAL